MNVYISLRDFNGYEETPTDDLIPLLSQNMNSISIDLKAKLFSECVLRAVFDNDKKALLELKKIYKNKSFATKISKLEKECERIKSRTTTVVVPTNKSKIEKKGSQQDSVFDVGPLYEKKFSAFEPEKKITYKMDHCSLSLNEIAAAQNLTHQRTADLEIIPYENRSQNDIHYLLSGPTLHSSDAQQFKSAEYNYHEDNLIKLIKLAESHNTPIITKIKFNDARSPNPEIYIFGPPKSTNAEDKDALTKPADWQLMKLDLDQKQIDSVVVNTDIIYDFKMPAFLHTAILAKMYVNESELKEAETRRKEALSLFDDHMPIIASRTLTGLVHNEMLDERVARAKKLAREGKLTYLKRSEQLYLLDVNTNTSCSGYSYYLKDHKLENFTQRSTMNYVYHNLNKTADLCFMFDNISKDDFDETKKHFRTPREYSYSLLRIERSLEEDHTDYLFKGTRQLLAENKIVGQTSIKNQDCFSNKEAYEKWEQYRHNPALLKAALEKTIYIASGLQEQPTLGWFWSNMSDLEIIQECFNQAKKYHIKLDLNLIPDGFQEKTKMTTLMLAIHKKDSDLIKLLIDEGADIEPVRNNMASYLDSLNVHAPKGTLEYDLQDYFCNPVGVAINAARHNHLDVLKTLQFNAEMLEPMLNEAVLNKHHAVVKYLIDYAAAELSLPEDALADDIISIAAKAGLQEYNHWKTELKSEITIPLHFVSAADNGHIDLVKELIKGNPIPLAIENAIKLAGSNRHEEVLSYLLKYAKEKNYDPTQMINRHNLLSSAASSLNMTNMLLEYKPDVNKEDEHKMTPLIRAINDNNADVIRSLLKNGADPLKLDAIPLRLAYQSQNKKIMGDFLKHIPNERLLTIIKALRLDTGNFSYGLHHQSEPPSLYDVTHFLLKSGLNPNVTLNSKSLLEILDGPTFIISAEDKKKTKDLLIQYGAKIQTPELDMINQQYNLNKPTI